MDTKIVLHALLNIHSYHCFNYLSYIIYVMFDVSLCSYLEAPTKEITTGDNKVVLCCVVSDVLSNLLLSQWQVTVIALCALPVDQRSVFLVQTFAVGSNYFPISIKT